MSTTRNTDTVEVIMRDQRRRRWSLAEKAALVRRSYEPGMSVSLVARQEGVAASLSTAVLLPWAAMAQTAPAQDATTLPTVTVQEQAIDPNPNAEVGVPYKACLLYTSPSPRDGLLSRMPSSA